MNNWQKVINVSLAVIVTLLIYQNQQLQKEVDTLEGYAQLDIDNVLKRISQNEKDTEYSILMIDGIDKAINDIFPMIQDLEDIAFNSLDNHKTELNEIKRSIRRLPKPKTTGDVKTIINGCAVPLWNVRADGLAHGHKKLVC
tara:strand:- start:51 stop:476 length:426 start_codon:yes stop_codon:yes gene_type:complete